MKRECKICGKVFKTEFSRKLTCSPECANINKRQNTNRWNKMHHTAYQRKRQNGHVICKICGAAVFRDYVSRTTKQMHDECVYRDCLKTLEADGVLNKTQVQRLYSRGWTLEEFKNEYMEKDKGKGEIV